MCRPAGTCATLATLKPAHKQVFKYVHNAKNAKNEKDLIRE